MKRFFAIIFFSFLVQIITAQEYKHAVGIQLTAIDYFGPQSSKYFIHDGWNYPKSKFLTHLYWKPAIQINHWYRYSSKIELKSNLLISSLQTPSGAKDSFYIKSIIGKSEKNAFYVAVDEKVNYYLLNQKFKPYLTSGFSLILNKNVSFALPIGIGFTYPFMDKVLFNFESNYKLCFSKNSYNSLNHSVGIVYNLKNKQHKEKIVEIKNEPILTEKIIVDTDNDGVEDSLDLCPNKAGKLINNGCPDTDRDGIFDNEDKCPEIAGSIIFLGCPDKDNDGVSDVDDKCPDEPGTITSLGCPEISETLISAINASSKGIQFESSQDVLKEESFVELDKVAILLKENPSLNIEIEGHTDSSGIESKNLELSQRRADVCKKYLVEKGIDEDRISSVGFGSMKPVEDNLTPEGRAKNRRIDLILVK